MAVITRDQLKPFSMGHLGLAVYYHWGSDFYEQIGKDLRKELPDVKSFSARNLQNMHQFYRLFPRLCYRG